LATNIVEFLKGDVANTLEQLLARSTSVKSIEHITEDEMIDDRCVKVDVNFSFNTGMSSDWVFLVPTYSSTKFEYWMLGEIGDLKTSIDDEITDAINEIVSNICGSLTTTINAQGFSDISGLEMKNNGYEIINCKNEAGSLINILKFVLEMDGEDVEIYISYDDEMKVYLSEEAASDAPSSGGETFESSSSASSDSGAGVLSVGNSSMVPQSSINMLLGDEAVENLKLLFDIKLKLSVRLGTKTVLLKNILQMDLGSIIELDQVVTEPLDILINGVKIGEGEAVVIDGKFGVKIKHIGTKKDRINQISF
jgi:flagellar motor switch protein FliN/FliY